MDCKLEPTPRTLVRIECLVLQGIFHSIIRILWSFVSIPFTPPMFVLFMMGNVKARPTGLWGWIKSLFVWFIQGCGIAACAPAVVIYESIISLYRIPKMEWDQRWKGSIPKKPNGEPLEILSDEDRMIQDAAIAYSVLKTYNEEAKQYGEGIDMEMP